MTDMTQPAGRPPRPCKAIAVRLPLTLGQFLKLAGFASTGGEAKRLVMAGAVRVNGDVDTRRGRKLVVGDEVEVAGAVVRVEDRGSDTAGATRD